MATELDTEKAIEILLYVAPKMGNSIYNSLKIIYLADKKHLEETGSFMYGETYSALDLGPVPSFAYDVAKVGTGRNCYNSELVFETPNFSGAFDISKGTQRMIEPLREASLDFLALSDLEALNATLAAYKDLGFAGLKSLSHDSAYHATIRNSPMSKQAIAATTDIGAELVQHLESEHVDRHTG